MTDAIKDARAQFVDFVERAGFCDPVRYPDESKALEALIASVRAETLREVRGVVDNLTHSRAHPDDYYYSVSICDHSERDGRGGYDVYVERTDLLAALDALAQPEGTA